MNEAQLNEEIDRLKTARDWVTLDSLYQKASASSQSLERRLFFDWERSTLLATELNQPATAMTVLARAELAGGPIEVIAPQVEAIRSAALNNPEVQAKGREIYQAWLQRYSMHQLSVQIRTWYRSLPAPPHTAQIDEGSLDGSLLDEADIIEEVPVQPEKHTLTPQYTISDPIDPQSRIWSQIIYPEANLSPIAHLNLIRDYCELKELTLDEKAKIEPILWHIASQSGQWRLWTQLFERYLLPSLEREELSPERSFQLGSIFEIQLKELDRAIELYQLVLSQDPRHDEAFDRLRDLFRITEDWEKLGRLLMNFAAQSSGVRDAHDRFEMCVEAGDCFAHQLKNQPKALTAWFQALEIIPDSKQVFVRLVETYQHAGKWAACIKVLRQLSNLEEDQTKSAFHLYQVGILQRDQLNDHYLAVRTFDEALDRDPSFMKAFQAIDDTLGEANGDLSITERRDRYYRKMLIRAVENQLSSSLIAELGLQIGAMNSGPLQQWEEAQRAYELVLEYEPTSDEAHLGLVETASRLQGGQASVDHAFAWVRRAPNQPLAYLSLFERAMQIQRWDQAWCASMALDVLGSHHPEVTQHLEAGRALAGARLSRTINADEWRLLEWAQFEWGGQGDEWGTIIAQLTPMLIELTGHQARAWGVNPKRDAVPADTSTVVGRVVQYICDSLNLTRPQIWLCTPPSGQLFTPLCLQGVIGLGLNRQIVSELNIEQLACMLAYGITLTQKRSWLAATPEQRALLQCLPTVLKTGQTLRPNQVTPFTQKYEASLQSALSSLHATQLNPIISLAHQAGPLADWLLAIEQTALRAALLICSDPRLIKQLMGGVEPLSKDDQDERLYKLLLFSVSPPYLTLRKQLGIGWENHGA